LEYIDVNRASIAYANPSRGDSSQGTIVRVGVSNVGIVVSLPSTQLQLTSNVSGVGVSVSRIVASSPALLDLDVRIAAYPTVIKNSVPLAITITLVGGGSLKSSTFSFTALPPGEPIITYFAPTRFDLPNLIPLTAPSPQRRKPKPFVAKSASGMCPPPKPSHAPALYPPLFLICNRD